MILLVAGAALLALPVPLGNFWAYVMGIGVIFAMVALSLSVLGWIGEISLGHAAFMGFGVMAAGWLQTNGVPFEVWLLPLILISLPISLAVGAVSLKLKGTYLAIATLAFGLLAEKAVFGRFLGGRGGGTGVAGALQKPTIFGLTIGSDVAYLYVLIAFLAMLIAVAWLVRRSTFGKSLRALRDSEAGFVSLGYSPMLYRLAAFTLSGAFAVIAGALYGIQLGLVSADAFGSFLSIFFYGVAVIGGLGGIAGPVVAGILFGIWPFLLNRLIGNVVDETVAFADFQYALAGLVVILLAMYLPGGLEHALSKLRRKSEEDVGLDQEGPLHKSAPAGTAT